MYVEKWICIAFNRHNRVMENIWRQLLGIKKRIITGENKGNI